jgi:hypothetical protein
MRRLDLLPSSPFFPTASELRRAAECVAPWALGLSEAEEASSEWAEQGRRLHAAAEVISKGDECADPLSFLLPDEVASGIKMLEAIHVLVKADFGAAKYGKNTWHTEQGIKWRPGVLEDEAALCERQPGERLRGWFSGTVDLAYVRHDDVLLVADWKFGPRELVNGEPAKDSCQGFFLALAFCQALGITGSSDAVVVARFERRMVSEDGIEVDGHDITWGELCAWRDVLEGLAKRITSAVDAAPKLSAACGHCKAKEGCPSWLALETSILAEISTANIESLCQPPRNDDDARALYHAIDAGKRLVATWDKWQDAYVLTHEEGVVVGLGLKIKAIPTKDREVIDTPEGLDAIGRIVPGSIIVQRKATLGSIKAAARDGAGSGITSASDRAKTKDAKEKDAFALLIEAGAVIDKGKKLTVREVRSDEKEY